MYFQCYKDAAGYWRWRLRAANQQIIAVGEGYANRNDCLHAIQLVAGSADVPIYKVQ